MLAMDCEGSGYDCQADASKSSCSYDIEDTDNVVQKLGCYHGMQNSYETSFLARHRMNAPKVKRLRKPTKFRLYEKFEPRFMYRKIKPFHSQYDASGICVAPSGFKKREITTIQEHEDFVHYNHHRKHRFSRSTWKRSHNKSEEKLEMLIQKFKDGLESCSFKPPSVQCKMSEDVTQMFSEIKL